jgi:hypothetical protein
MKKFSCFFLVQVLFFAFACESKREKKEEKIMIPEVADEEDVSKLPTSFYYYDEKAAFPEAVIEMFSPLGNQVFRPGKVPFEFNLKNYPYNEGLSGGQLKLILNSSDPVGYNMPVFSRELKEGTYRAVAYLVDEEGLALKEFGNYIDRDFRVGDTRPFPYSAEPYLVLNMPTHRQTYSEGEEVTIDFLLLGGDLLLDNLKVKITANEYVYEIEEIRPVRIANLPKGEYRLTVQLMKKDGKALDGPFSTANKLIVVQ